MSARQAATAERLDLTRTNEFELTNSTYPTV
jgi:hypothetical protein